MGWGTTTILVLAGLVSLLALASALRRPIIARMAVRNALRRPRQTLTVIAGLLVGTAIISAALVAGDSAGSAIRGYVYQSLGRIDESVAIEGYPFFPESVADELAADPAIARETDGIATHAIWEGAIDNPRTRLFEPRIALVGYDPAADAAFGNYDLRGGATDDGRGIQRGQAYATTVLADRLDLRTGDTVQVRFTPPVDPVLPDILPLQGTVAASAGVPGVPLPLPPVPQPAGATHPFEVRASATRITAVVVPTDLVTVSTLGLRLHAPDGTVHDAPAPLPQPGSLPRPAWINVTSAPDETLEQGTWTLEVRSDAAVAAGYRGILVVGYPVYDLALLRERAEALEEEYGGLEDQVEGLSPFGNVRTLNLTIVGITDGGRGDLFDFRNALFFRIDEAQEAFDRVGEVNLVKFSNPGGPRGGEAGTDDAVAAINATLRSIKADTPDVASIQSLEVLPLKRDFVEVADDTGQTLTGLLVFAGSLSIITGLLLIVNIFAMLAEERRSELGMARAVGLSQRDLVRMFLSEGALYAVAASAAGAIAGLGLAYVMVQVMNAVISRLSEDLTFPPIQYEPTLTAVLAAFGTGILLTFTTIWIASRAQGRLNIVRAIRRIEEPDRTGNPRTGFVWGTPIVALGLLATVLGWWPGAVASTPIANYRFTLQVAGPLLLCIGLGIALRPHIRHHRLAPALAGLLALYYAGTYFAITEYENVSEANVVGSVRGVILTLCVVILVVHFEALPRAVGRLLARARSMRAVAAPAVSYPLHKKFRAGMTLAMFSVVILSVCFFSIFGALFETDPRRQTGGYEVEGRTTLAIEDLADHDAGPNTADLVISVDRLADYSTEDPDFITVAGERTGQYGDFLHHVYGYDDAFVDHQEFRLLWRDAAYADDKAAYRAVLQRDDAVIVSYQYSTDARNQDLAHKVGDTLELHLGDETTTYTIVGIQEQYHFPGIFLPRPDVEGLFPTTDSLYLYNLRAGTDAVEAAKILERKHRSAGLDAEASVEEVIREQESFRQVLGAMKLFLGLGLVVGVLSLGIVTSRSVLERRQEIGMLRALGFTGRQVRRIFFTEVTFTLLLGALVGFACAVLVTYGLWFAIIRELNYAYVIPWREIGLLLGVSYIVALVATAAPIGRSGRVAPAEALRYLE